MNKILQRIANTIVANLANTEPIGLFDGRIGLCLFLYKYARYSGSSIYEDVASDLLDDIFCQLKPDMSPSAIDGLSGIGYGLSILLREGFLESDPDDHIFQDIDEALFRDVKSSLIKETRFPISLCSSGIYLLSRMTLRMNEIESVWISGVIENIRMLVMGSVQKKNRLKLSLLNSMLYVLCGLHGKLDMSKITIENLLKEILHLSIQSIDSQDYQDIDIVLLKHQIKRLPLVLKEERLLLLNKIERTKCFVESAKADIWYDNLWWSILYDVPVVEGLSLSDVESYIDKKIQDSFYDEMTVNSKLSAVGLWIMNNFR